MIRNRTTWVAYILLALYAYFLNVLGPIAPFLRDEFQLSYTASSLYFSAFAVGILIIGLGGHLVIPRLGRWGALSVGSIGLGLGALLLALARTPPLIIGAAFLMGCIGSLILAVVPPTLSEEHGELRGIAISEANVLSSLVAAAAPIMVGWFAGLLFGWRMALVIAGLPVILIGMSSFKTGRSHETQSMSDRPRGKLPFIFWFYWTCLVLAVSVEFCMIYWSAAYMEIEFGLLRANAAQTVSLFLAGMITGRLASSRLLRYVSARKVILISILLGLLGFLLYWSATHPWVGMIGLALTGLGVASLYPLILSMSIGAAAGVEAQAGARTTLASGVAILLLPLILGWLADLVGLKGAFSVVAVLFILLLIMILIAGRFTPGFAAAHNRQ